MFTLQLTKVISVISPEVPSEIPCMCDLFSEAVQEPFRDADLLPTLQKMLDDPVVAVEVKFSALGLICSLANSGQYKTLWKKD